MPTDHQNNLYQLEFGGQNSVRWNHIEKGLPHSKDLYV